MDEVPLHWDKVASLYKEYQAKRQQELHLKREKDRIKSRQPVDWDRIEEIEEDLIKLDIRCTKIQVFLKSIR